MSPDTRFHETVRRWRRNRRRYELATLIGVVLLAVLSAYLTARIKEAADAAERAGKAEDLLAQERREEAVLRAAERQKELERESIAEQIGVPATTLTEEAIEEWRQKMWQEQAHRQMPPECPAGVR